MPGPIIIGSVVIPESAIEVAFARSSGPGGQNVNKVSSKVDLRIQLDEIQGLGPDAKARLLRLVDNRLDAEGRLQVVSQLTRDQARNIEDAIQKVRALVERALQPPVPRIPTRPSRGAVRRRLQDKKRQSLRKQERKMTGD